MKTTKLGKWAMVGLIAAAMAAPLTSLAATQANTQTRQVRPDCPNGGVQLRDGSGRTREGSLHQNRGNGLKDGTGRTLNKGRGLKDGTGRGAKGGGGPRDGSGRAINSGTVQN